MHSKASAHTAPATGTHDRMAVRAELDQRRRVQIGQLHDLAADTAEGIATADETRLRVTRVLEIVADAAVAEVDAALLRLESGVYGRCERCTERILPERLKMLPTARLCTRCQYITESGQAERLPYSRAWPIAGPSNPTQDVYKRR